MRKVKLNGEEANLVFHALDNGSPERGLNVNEIRVVIPIMDKLEVFAKKMLIPGGERMEFQDNIELDLKETEFSTLTAKLEASAGWANVSVVGRKVVALLDRVKETPSTGVDK